MLTSVKYKWKKVSGTLLHCGDDRRHFHEVRPRADDVDDFEHVRFELCSWCYESVVKSSQYHLAVAGGCEARIDQLRLRLRTHPLPRGGTDCFQRRISTKHKI